MKTPLRYQSRLLPRRSYKPGRNPRRVGVVFRPADGFAILIAKQRAAGVAPPERIEIAETA
jgi:hypothetical protein